MKQKKDSCVSRCTPNVFLRDPAAPEACQLQMGPVDSSHFHWAIYGGTAWHQNILHKMWLPDVDTNFALFFSLAKLLKLRQVVQRCFRSSHKLLTYDSNIAVPCDSWLSWETNHPVRMCARRGYNTAGTAVNWWHTHSEANKKCTSASQNLTVREIQCYEWLYAGETSITVMSWPPPNRNTLKIKWREHIIWISFRKPSSYQRHLYVMLWFHHLLSGGHWFLCLSVELPYIFQEKEGKHFRLELSLGCDRECKQRHQSWITGRNLSWHRSASTLPQEQNRIKTHPICASPLPKCMLI